MPITDREMMGRLYALCTEVSYQAYMEAADPEGLVAWAVREIREIRRESEDASR